MSGVLDSITTEFEKAAAPFEPLSLAVEKHGSWEWSAGVHDKLGRVVGLTITPRGAFDKGDGLPSEVNLEVWAGADTADSFRRETVASRNTSTLALDVPGQSEWLWKQVHIGVERARSFNVADLTDSYARLPKTRRTA